MRRISWILPAAFIVAGTALLGRDLYLRGKAALAEVLIRRAWSDTLRTGRETRPWPSADTHPVARLRIPSLGYDELVLEGASPRTLAFGPARMMCGASPGEPGNLLLAGHRTSWFLPLSRLQRGDTLVVETCDARARSPLVRTYRVVTIEVVSPRDVSFLRPTPEDCLTLITCWPFGAAPRSTHRFVVRAELVRRVQSASGFRCLEMRNDALGIKSVRRLAAQNAQSVFREEPLGLWIAFDRREDMLPDGAPAARILSDRAPADGDTADSTTTQRDAADGEPAECRQDADRKAAEAEDAGSQTADGDEAARQAADGEDASRHVADRDHRFGVAAHLAALRIRSDGDFVEGHLAEAGFRALADPTPAHSGSSAELFLQRLNPPRPFLSSLHTVLFASIRSSHPGQKQGARPRWSDIEAAQARSPACPLPCSFIFGLTHSSIILEWTQCRASRSL